MTVYSTGTPVNTHSTTGSVTGTWGSGQFRTAGHLLVAVVTCAATTSVTATATTSGWVNRFEQPNTATAQVRVAIWTTTATGSDAAPTFTSTETGTAGGMDCMLFELQGANTTTPIDTSGTYASGAVAGTVSPTATTGGNLAGSGEFAIACFAQERAAGILTWTDTGTGLFSTILNGNGISTVLQTYIGVVVPSPGGVTLNDAGAFSTNTTAFAAGLVVAFAQAPATPAINWAYANNAAATVTSGGTTAPAGGTSESWTVNVTGAFPVASATAQPPTQFTVCDPALPSEKFLVTGGPGGTGGSQSWTVTRGAEGTTPVSHTAGFAIVNVTTGGFLTAASKELSATAYVDCDYTGVVDASAAFNAALASLPVTNGRSVGKIIFGPGNVKIAVTPNNPGPNVYIEGAGKWATFISSYVTGGDCFRVFDATAFSVTDKTVDGGGISGLTIDGSNAGASSVGLHIGDIFCYAVDAVVQNFSGTGSKGVWFDNEWFYTEMLRGDLLVSGCTQCVVFDNPSTAANTSGGSFARLQMHIRLEQGLNGSGQVYGDGVVLQNGALIVDADLMITGNFVLSAASTTAAVLRLSGTTPAGHLSAGRVTAIVNSRLHVGVELDTHGANSFAPMTINSDGTANITQCYGQLSFGTGPSTFVSSNAGSLINKCLFQVGGDVNLGGNAQFQVYDAEQFLALTAPYTLANSASAQQIFNATAAGTLTVPASTSYFFECEFDLTSLSSSAHTLSFGFGGTATYTSCRYRIESNTGAAATLAAWNSAVFNVATASVFTASSTTTTVQALVRGIIRINAAGTVIPQITQTTNTAAAVVGVNSWFRLWPVGSDSVSHAGNWSYAVPTYNLPPDTRAVGSGNPPVDMDSVVDVLNHSLLQRAFYIDQYGADPTGATLSDTAWTNCYADAAAAVQTLGGAMIVFGAGFYKFSVATVAISDTRIGLRGAGRQATTIETTGSTGSLVKITGTTGNSAGGAAPVSGFTVYGWNAGAGVVGLEYGDRYGGTLTDVSSNGFNLTGSMGFWFHDATALSEGSFIAVMANSNTNDFVFQGNASSGSFDYSHIILKVTTSTAGGVSGSVLSVIGHMQITGSYLQLSGNIQATTGLTKTCLTIGNSGSDVSVISGCTLNILVEADTSAGTVVDATIQGASGFGIDKCNGVIYFQNVSGTYSIGSVTSPAVFRAAGYLNGPLFSGHGTLTALGTGSQLFTYVG